ncbi:glycosyl transferase [Candidatus Marsarchaeota G2 archaeon ECH_B_1]|jgi:Glycosyltransferase|uniref:Glycosyl transferase n=1 Tax=Candidatus Marsarchaeota G2 archaeon ECH_B_1 TaxID=1978159 RepID=A0A2R6BME2_9ARCH|nr:MAG: glycosyl transferase [Candidatus Marsarchaeota G2 archaeon ECH_B_1]
MRILVVNHRDPMHPLAGGAEEGLLQIFSRVVKRGVEVTWLCEKFDGAKSEEWLKGIRILRKGNAATLHLYAPLEARKYDAVIDSVAHAAPFFSFLTNQATTALIHHVHQDVLKLEMPIVKASVIGGAEKGVRLYKRFIAKSKATQNDLIKKIGINEKRISVIYDGIDHAVYKPGEKSREPMILWLNRFKNYKNPLDAFIIHRKLRSKAKLVIAGYGELKWEVEELTKKNPNTVYVGKVGGERKVRLYQQAWVTLSTSYIEGWGLTLVEANACGTPVVSYNTGSAQEIIVHGKNGFLVNYKDYEQVAKSLDYILEDENTMMNMAKQSHDLSLKYDWEKTAEKYVEYVQKLVENPV